MNPGNDWIPFIVFKIPSIDLQIQSITFDAFSACNKSNRSSRLRFSNPLALFFINKRP